MKLAGDDGKVPFCTECNKYWFDSFASSAMVLVANEFDEIVLLRQGYISDIYTTLVSGYISPGETAEQTAVREVKEEVGITLDSLEYDGTVWFDKGDLLIHCYVGRTHKSDLVLSQEVDSAEWAKAEDVAKTLYPDAPGNAAYALYKNFMKRRGTPLST